MPDAPSSGVDSVCAVESRVGHDSRLCRLLYGEKNVSHGNRNAITNLCPFVITLTSFALFSSPVKSGVNVRSRSEEKKTAFPYHQEQRQNSVLTSMISSAPRVNLVPIGMSAFKAGSRLWIRQTDFVVGPPLTVHCNKLVVGGRKKPTAQGHFVFHIPFQT